MTFSKRQSNMFAEANRAYYWRIDEENGSHIIEWFQGNEHKQLGGNIKYHKFYEVLPINRQEYAEKNNDPNISALFGSALGIKLGTSYVDAFANVTKNKILLQAAPKPLLHTYARWIASVFSSDNESSIPNNPYWDPNTIFFWQFFDCHNNPRLRAVVKEVVPNYGDEVTDKELSKCLVFGYSERSYLGVLGSRYNQDLWGMGRKIQVNPEPIPGQINPPSSTVSVDAKYMIMYVFDKYIDNNSIRMRIVGKPDQSVLEYADPIVIEGSETYTGLTLYFGQYFPTHITIAPASPYYL